MVEDHYFVRIEFEIVVLVLELGSLELVVVELKHRKKDYFEDDEEFKVTEEPADQSENNNIAGTYSFGLRPSAKFIAHKLEETKVD